MKRQWLHKILAVILLGVFALHITPREFLHLLVPHEDTRDDHAAYDGTAFSIKHQHCDFLQIGVEPYNQISFHYQAPVRSVLWTYALPYIPVVEKLRYADASLRAPPARFI
ncbi:hypothetical protein [Chitinophaga japonensis]|uniref:Uncharacterized protein n=1 Tax=Chitinophaga japonensis TaxID=104662 RepID=A0A562TBD8_CHIJA|nr:hypothetical protein [Chitinophaga japonensis]TWI90889.1 hypothetical protein LX66_0249 [Chitinophaga japonensis]